MTVHCHFIQSMQWNLHIHREGHLGTRHFVLYIEIVLSLEVHNVLSRYEVLHLGPLNLSFIWRFFLLCPLYGVSIKRGFTEYQYTCTCTYRLAGLSGAIVINTVENTSITQPALTRAHPYLCNNNNNTLDILYNTSGSFRILSKGGGQ